jgi:CheY-like chemotaxis protein
MKPSSRTPEGQPNHCPVCGNETHIEASWPTEDAPCPRCGHLLWFPGLTVRRVLIADNDSTAIEICQEYLSDLDLDTRVATDAAEILACIECWHPAVLLLNTEMPDGFEVCREIKNGPEKHRTMVLMTNNLNDLGDIELAVEAWVDDFIGKPVVKSEFSKRIRNLLALHQAIDEDSGLR